MTTGKLKAIMVGCGGISGAWLKPIKDFDDIEMVALVDLNIENAEKRKSEFEFKNAVVSTSLSEAIEKTGAEVVFDCTVPEVHSAVAIEALNSGCHVLGEKPMSDSMDSAEHMVRAAEKNDKIYSVIQNRRYIPEIIAYKDIVQQGELGNLTTLNADFYLGCHFGGFRDEMDHVLVLDMAIHSFDEARMISGKDPVSVYCHEWNPSGSWYKHGASAMVIFEMSDGVVFNYRGSWCANGLSTSWQCDWRAICENGTATWDGEKEIKAQKVIAPEEGTKFTWDTQDIEVKVDELEIGGHGALIREFADCVKNGNEPQTICTDNIKSLAMVHKAIESAKTGKKVIL